MARRTWRGSPAARARRGLRARTSRVHTRGVGRESMSRFYEAPRAAGAPASLLLRASLFVLVADREIRLQLQKTLLADTLHIHQLLDFLEASVLLPVLDDALGGLPANARQRLDLRQRGGVQIHRRGRRSRG